MDIRVPQTGPELMSYYKYHYPRMDEKSAMPVTKKGMRLLIDEFDRLVAVEAAYEELKAKRGVGRPRKKASDEQ